jgi:DNA-binding NarL/FixJ family response regulator
MAATVRQRPTRRQLEVLRACIVAGSIAGAAETLDIAESTARQHLSGLYRRTGCLNVAQAAYLLGRSERRLGLLDGPSHTQRTGPSTCGTRAV